MAPTHYRPNHPDKSTYLKSGLPHVNAAALIFLNFFLPHRNVVLTESQQHLSDERSFHLVIVVLIALRYDRQHRKAHLHRQDALVEGAADDLGVLGRDLGKGVLNDLFRVSKRIVDVYLDRYGDPGIHLREVGHALDVLVADDLDVAASADESRAAHADLLNHSSVAVNVDNIADLILALEDHGYAGEDVGYEVSRAHGDADTDDSDGGEDRVRIHAQIGQRVVNSTSPQKSITILVSENMFRPLFHFPVKI